MSWRISNIKNTVEIPLSCAKELWKRHQKAGGYQGEELWYSQDDVRYDGKLSFNEDHMEWMDYLGRVEFVIEVLLKHKVKGDICFGSLDGDNAGQFWGYRFDGEGGMAELKGRLEWEAARTQDES